MQQTFTVEGRDQFGHVIELREVQWSATSGTIGADGLFITGEEEGNFLVTATIQSTMGTARVTVVRAVRPGQDPEPSLPHIATKLTWSGEVAPQK